MTEICKTITLPGLAIKQDRRNKKCKQFWGENLNGRDRMTDQEVDARAILKRISEK
jgi:hypothetical protein